MGQQAMSIDNHTFWVIVNIPDGDAITSPKDQRAALRFETAKAAQEYLSSHGMDRAFFMVVRVRA